MYKQTRPDEKLMYFPSPANFYSPSCFHRRPNTRTNAAWQGIAALCLSEGPIRVIIVDSIIALFRVDFSGRGDLSLRQQKLGRHLATLLQMATVRLA